MRITVRRENAQDDVQLSAGARRRPRRRSGVVAAILLALVAAVGAVPGFAGAAFGVQVQADDDPLPELPPIIPPILQLPDPPVPVVPTPVVPTPVIPIPDPPKVTPQPPKKTSPKPSVAAPKNKKKQHKQRHHASPEVSTTPPATTAAPVAFVPVAFHSPRFEGHGALQSAPVSPPDVIPPPDPSPEAAIQAATRPVSAEPQSGNGLLWFAFVDVLAIAALVGGSLWRRRRLGPQW